MENAKILIGQAMENEKQITSLHDINEQENDASDTEVRRLMYDEYRQKIGALEAERDQKTAEIRRIQQTRNDEYKAKTEKLYTAIATVKRILSFFDLKENRNLEIDDEDIHNHERYKESLGFFFNDDYLKIKLFIAENSKPKNKYALLAFGKCLFDKEQLELPYSYGLPTYESQGYSLKSIIREAPSIQELKDWLEKAQQSTKVNDVLFTKKLIEYAKVRKEYLAIMETYTTKDFLELVAWICDKCGHFYTIWESVTSDYKCYRCQSIMRQIPKLSKEKQADMDSSDTVSVKTN